MEACVIIQSFPFGAASFPPRRPIFQTRFGHSVRMIRADVTIVMRRQKEEPFGPGGSGRGLAGQGDFSPPDATVTRQWFTYKPLSPVNAAGVPRPIELTASK